VLGATARVHQGASFLPERLHARSAWCSLSVPQPPPSALLPWRTFVDMGNAGAGPIARTWNLSATPTLYVIDHKGVIRYKWAGAPGEKLIDGALDNLMKAAERARHE
jgi:hypothetical protein